MTRAQYQKRKYLSVSTLCAFNRCPRRMFYQKSGLRTHEESPNPLFGSAMHKAVPELLRTEDVGKAMQAFLSVWDSKLNTDLHNPDTAYRALNHYLFTHAGGNSIFTLQPPPEGAMKVDDKTSDWEIPFAIDIGLPIPLYGRIDGLARHRDTGEFWGWEFKTTSKNLTSNFLSSFEFNIQVLTYALALKTLTDKSLSGVLVEAMLVHKTKVDNMVHPIVIQDHHLEDALAWLRYNGAQLLACEEKGEWPKDPTGCTAYTHFYIPSWRCEFTHLCEAPDWRDMEQFYQVTIEQEQFRLV